MEFHNHQNNHNNLQLQKITYMIVLKLNHDNHHQKE
jgi:hypothetical protein